MKKPVSKISKLKLILIAAVLVVGGFLAFKSMMVSPQVALIANGGDQPVSCVSNVGTFTATDSCGEGMVNRVDYTCLNTDKKGYEGGVKGDCIDTYAAYVRATGYCGQTCTTPTATPQPSCVPNPCPGDGRTCKLAALPPGQSYCPIATSTPYPSMSPTASPSPTLTPFPSPTPTPNPNKSFFKITNHPNPVNITCTEGDINCGFYLPVIYQNITNTDLYQATYWTDTPGVKFSDQYGNLTDQKVVLTSPIFFEPGLGPNIIIATKVTADMNPGVYVRRVYMDAKQCNQIGGVLDCYYGGSAGATTFTINLSVVPKSISTPLPTLTPGCYTESRFCLQGLLGGKCPVATVCPSATPTPTPTPTPVPSPVYSSKPSPISTPISCGTTLNKWQFRESCGTNMYRYIDFNCTGFTVSQVLGSSSMCKSESAWVSEARSTCMQTQCASIAPTPQATTKAAPIATLAPRSVTKQTFSQCFNTCRANKRGAVSCVRYCMR